MLCQHYGTWKSPIAAKDLALGAKSFVELTADQHHLYWTQSMPEEKGRVALFMKIDDDVRPLATHASVKTRVHEYGGGALLAAKNRLFFVDDNKQCLVCFDGKSYQELTSFEDGRIADMTLSPSGNYLVAVCEKKIKERVINCLVLIQANEKKPVKTLVEGSDFYASPRISFDGMRLAWISWNFPHMPWDESRLSVADIDEQGNVSNQQIYGQKNQSLSHPLWSFDSELFVCCDASGYWNLYKVGQTLDPVCPMHAEFATPLWVLGRCSAAFIDQTKMAAVACDRGQDILGLIDLPSQTFRSLNLPFNVVRNVVVQNGRIYCFAASPTMSLSLVEVLFDGQWKILHKSHDYHIQESYISQARLVSCQNPLGEHVYGFYYAPCNPAAHAHKDEKPPLIVRSHGGPSSHATAGLSLDVQYWTSRGFAFLDVNYGGSTGHGRAYRKRLEENWGVVDVQDCISMAQMLSGKGLADQNRLLVRGSSAGGFTVLRALQTPVFCAGTSYYGVSDLELLLQDTHKFESQYLESLIGPYPEAKERYKERSPLKNCEAIQRPLLLLQGKQDPVVPLSQSENMYQALRNKKLFVAMILFDGESHGFRMADTIKRSISAENYFYNLILHLPLPPCEDAESFPSGRTAPF